MNTNRSGGNKVQVPDLRTMDLNAASAQLAQLGLVAQPDLSGVDQTSGGPWTVDQQQPQPGELLDPGGQVILKALSPTV